MSNPSRPNDGMQSSLNSVDRQFMMKAAQSDMTEIMSSRLALQRSNNQNVRSYAQMMIQHHTESSNKLKPLAQQKEVTLPKDISAEQKAMMTKLSKLSGTQFDQAYMNAQVQAHTMTEAEYRKQLAEGQDADVKAFANQILPVVVEHRQMAQNMVARR